MLDVSELASTDEYVLALLALLSKKTTVSVITTEPLVKLLMITVTGLLVKSSMLLSR